VLIALVHATQNFRHLLSYSKNISTSNCKLNTQSNKVLTLNNNIITYIDFQYTILDSVGQKLLEKKNQTMVKNLFQVLYKLLNYLA